MPQTYRSFCPCCPTCGDEMRLTGVAPTCKTVIYEYRCDHDGDTLDWRPSRVALLTEGGSTPIGDRVLE